MNFRMIFLLSSKVYGYSVSVQDKFFIIVIHGVAGPAILFPWSQSDFVLCSVIPVLALLKQSFSPAQETTVAT